LRGFAASHVQGVSRVTLAAGILTALAALSYYGGEHVAGLAGAMTPPQSAVEGTTPRTAAVGMPVPARPQQPMAPAPVDEATARAASYLDRAKSGDMVAQYNVAVLYARGDGFAQDFTSAAAWFAKAADAGSASAQFNLGVMYQRGLGVRQDPSEAFRWYRRAADRHYAPAEYNLAVAYAEGQGTPADPVAAARWYHQAAAQGLVPAMINFAILYEKGEGVERSPVDAYSWYRAAARRGDAVAENRAGELMAQFDAGKKRLAQMQSEAVAGTIRQSAPDMTPLPTGGSSDTAAPVANSGD
jgi:TPR repeat protein